MINCASGCCELKSAWCIISILIRNPSVALFCDSEALFLLVRFDLVQSVSRSHEPQIWRKKKARLKCYYIELQMIALRDRRNLTGPKRQSTLISHS